MPSFPYDQQGIRGSRKLVRACSKLYRKNLRRNEIRISEGNWEKFQNTSICHPASVSSIYGYLDGKVPVMHHKNTFPARNLLFVAGQHFWILSPLWERLVFPPGSIPVLHQTACLHHQLESLLFLCLQCSLRWRNLLPIYFISNEDNTYFSPF